MTDTLLLAGTIVPAGLGHSTIYADLDFETYSEAGFEWNELTQKYYPPKYSTKKGLPVIGMQRYAEHPSTKLLSAAYDLKDGKGKRLWVPGHEPLPIDLIRHVREGKIIEAWNVGFEYLIWNLVCVRLYGWPRLKPEQVRCAAAKSRAFALPGSLDPAGEVMDIKNKKLKDGKRLLTKFSMPRNPTKSDPRRRIHPFDEPNDAKKLYEYNIMDIMAEAELSYLTPDLIQSEQQFWYYDFLINRRGVRIDAPVVQASLSILEQAYRKYNGRLEELTNGFLTSATQVTKMRQFLQTLGVTVESLDAQHIEELLKEPLPPLAYKIIKIRELIGGSAIKKLYAMTNLLANDQRIHDIFMFHVARTGRHGGVGIQPQNFPNSGLETTLCGCGRYHCHPIICPWCGSNEPGKKVGEWNAAAMEDAIAVISTGSLELVEYFFGDALGAITASLRGMMISADGHDFICSDYSAIEAVVLSCLAGEDWRIDVFNSHGMIYETSASKIFRIPFEEFAQHKKETGQHHPARKKGKVAELASGYQGGLNAWLKFKADKFMTHEEIKQAVYAWRDESPAIVEFWGGQKRRINGRWEKGLYGLEGAAINAVHNPGVDFSYRSITYRCENDILYCRLPSGRLLTYHSPAVRAADEEWKGNQLSYEGWNNNPAKGRTNAWLRMNTYGGSLCENVVQAVARDILAHAVVNLEKAGYTIVLHVHDEIVAEVPENFGSVEEFEAIMMRLPDWAKDWPIRASGGWRAKRYTK